jgi:hypothetical protein
VNAGTDLLPLDDGSSVTFEVEASGSLSVVSNRTLARDVDGASVVDDTSITKADDGSAVEVGSGIGAWVMGSLVIKEVENTSISDSVIRGFPSGSKKVIAA